MSLQLVGNGPGRPEFLQVFNRLCVALREPADDSGVTQGIYFDALKDLPLKAVEAGATALSRERGRKFFPTTAEWRSAAELALTEQLRHAVKPAREEPWRLECERCEDTGWVLPLECDGAGGVPGCGRSKRHGAHTWTYACPCRPTNRTYIRNRQFGAGE